MSGNRFPGNHTSSGGGSGSKGQQGSSFPTGVWGGQKGQFSSTGVTSQGGRHGNSSSTQDRSGTSPRTSSSSLQTSGMYSPGGPAVHSSYTDQPQHSPYGGYPRHAHHTPHAGHNNPHAGPNSPHSGHNSPPGASLPHTSSTVNNRGGYTQQVGRGGYNFRHTSPPQNNNYAPNLPYNQHHDQLPGGLTGLGEEHDQYIRSLSGWWKEALENEGEPTLPTYSTKHRNAYMDKQAPFDFQKWMDEESFKKLQINP